MTGKQQCTAENGNMSPIKPKSMVSIKLHSVTHLTIFLASAGHQSALLHELIGAGYANAYTCKQECWRMSKAHRRPQTHKDKSSGDIYPVWSHRKDAPLVWLVINKGGKHQ